ncbi:MAG: regulatory protein RecX [Sphingomicrobium sp.]
MAVTRRPPSRDRQPRKPRPPLNRARLDELALHYVGRFATSRAKLAAYLTRKIRERGWDGELPDIPALVDRLARLGYVDDRAFALAKSRSLTSRGYGAGRVRQALHIAGIGDEEAVEARDHASARSVDAALHFARRRRIGPYASVAAEPEERHRALGAMIRAGHDFALAKVIVALDPGTEVDPADFLERD